MLKSEKMKSLFKFTKAFGENSEENSKDGESEKIKSVYKFTEEDSKDGETGKTALKEDIVYRILKAVDRVPVGVNPERLTNEDRVRCLQMLSLVADEFDAGMFKRASDIEDTKKLAHSLKLAQNRLDKKTEIAEALNARCKQFEKKLTKANELLIANNLESFEFPK